MGRVAGSPPSYAVDTAKPFTWTDQKLEAARLLGEGDLDDTQICARVPCSQMSLWRWKHFPAFMDRVRAVSMESEDAAVARGYGRKGRRVQALTHHVNLLDRIVEERAAHHATADPDIPGAGTGLLVYEETVLKTTVRNDRTQRVLKTEELVSRKWAVDAALIRERRALLMQVSKEVGGIVDRTMNLNVNVDGTAGEPPADLESLSGAILGRLVPAHDGAGASPSAPPSLPE